MIEPEDTKHVWELCPECEEEVMLDAELKVQTCPNCGKRIVPCAMCTACGEKENYCSKCVLVRQARMENIEDEMKKRCNNAYQKFLIDNYDKIHPLIKRADNHEILFCPFTGSCTRGIPLIMTFSIKEAFEVAYKVAISMGDADLARLTYYEIGKQCEDYHVISYLGLPRNSR